MTNTWTSVLHTSNSQGAGARSGERSGKSVVLNLSEYVEIIFAFMWNKSYFNSEYELKTFVSGILYRKRKRISIREHTSFINLLFAMFPKYFFRFVFFCAIWKYMFLLYLFIFYWRIKTGSLIASISTFRGLLGNSRYRLN